jgi:hypothetical protein
MRTSSIIGVKKPHKRQRDVVVDRKVHQKGNVGRAYKAKERGRLSTSEELPRRGRPNDGYGTPAWLANELGTTSKEIRRILRLLRVPRPRVDGKLPTGGNSPLMLLRRLLLIARLLLWKSGLF